MRAQPSNDSVTSSHSATSDLRKPSIPRQNTNNKLLAKGASAPVATAAASVAAESKIEAELASLNARLSEQLNVLLDEGIRVKGGPQPLPKPKQQHAPKSMLPRPIANGEGKHAPAASSPTNKMRRQPSRLPSVPRQQSSISVLSQADNRSASPEPEAKSVARKQPPREPQREPQRNGVAAQLKTAASSPLFPEVNGARKAGAKAAPVAAASAARSATEAAQRGARRDRKELQSADGTVLRQRAKANAAAVAAKVAKSSTSGGPRSSSGLAIHPITADASSLVAQAQQQQQLTPAQQQQLMQQQQLAWQQMAQYNPFAMWGFPPWGFPPNAQQPPSSGASQPSTAGGPPLSPYGGFNLNMPGASPYFPPAAAFPTPRTMFALATGMPAPGTAPAWPAGAAAAPTQSLPSIYR